MPCQHKFYDYLKLRNIDFEPETLLVGTFNPEVEGNKAEWYYGRFDNNFWDVLPRLYGSKSMRCSTPNEWKGFCKEHKIAITDLICSIEDADMNKKENVAKLKTFSDKLIANDFKNFEFNKVDNLLSNHKTIKNVYLTRGISDTFWKNLWKPIEKYSNENDLHEARLITPSGYAFYQQAKYNKLNPTQPLSLEDFILEDWKSKWHKLI